MRQARICVTTFLMDKSKDQLFIMEETGQWKMSRIEHSKCLKSFGKTSPDCFWSLLQNIIGETERFGECSVRHPGFWTVTIFLAGMCLKYMTGPIEQYSSPTWREAEQMLRELTSEKIFLAEI